MRIVSHRGFWLAPEDKNSPSAITRSVREGYGTETDVRDQGGRLVVSHDPASVGALAFEVVLEAFDGSGLPLAVNIKADGLGPLLAGAIRGRVLDWFAFDMSNAEMLKYQKAGLPYYTRQSDIEPQPILYDDARGVWLDAFHATWFDTKLISGHLEAGKDVCVVSPELHGREPQTLWSLLRPLARCERLMLCTDCPHEAQAFLMP